MLLPVVVTGVCEEKAEGQYGSKEIIYPKTDLKKKSALQAPGGGAESSAKRCLRIAREAGESRLRLAGCRAQAA